MAKLPKHKLEIVLPPHIGLIMDGNGRWAKKRFLPKKAGHSAGAKAVKTLSEKMDAIGFRMMTIYAFSTENWKRSDGEVYDLMNILRAYIREHIEQAKRDNMRISVIGERGRLDRDIQEDIEMLEALTESKTGLRINIAINYGGRDDITRAVKSLVRDVQSGLLRLGDIDEDAISARLDTAGLPDPDIIIRTSGEHRLSNFLTWQSAYSELFVVDKLWPDFTIDDMMKVVEQYNRRERRFGGR